eukprot:2870542-Pyramimonas_sp.AAC.3
MKSGGSGSICKCSSIGKQEMDLKTEHLGRILPEGRGPAACRQWTTVDYSALQRTAVDCSGPIRTAQSGF